MTTKRVMLPARPDAAVLRQAAETTKALEAKASAEEVNCCEEESGGAKEEVLTTVENSDRDLYESHAASVKRPRVETGESCHDQRDENWLDYVISGSTSREKRRSGNAQGQRSLPSIDLSKGGLVKRSTNVQPTTQGVTVGDGGRAWRNRILRRNNQEQPGRLHDNR